jgi:dTMP kinase
MLRPPVVGHASPTNFRCPSYGGTIVIICLEGINGSGKTSLAEILMDRWLTLGGCTATKFDPVQGTAFGQSVCTAIMDTADLNPEAETLAFASARLHAAPIITPEAKDLIVLERWAGAVTAYGTVSGTDPALLSALESVLLASMAINHTVLVDVPGQTATERLSIQSGKNRFETIGADYLENVRQSYLDWAHRRRAMVVSGTMSLVESAAWASDLINSFLNGEQESAKPTPPLSDPALAKSEESDQS